MSAQPEAIQDKIARYTRQNGGGPLTDKQRARCGLPVAEQHEQLKPVEINTSHSDFDLLCAALKGRPTEVKAGVYLIELDSHPDSYELNRQAESMRSKITRLARIGGREYSTWRQSRQGKPYLTFQLR